MGNDFYTGLEAEFRGSRDLIKARLRIYAPLLQALGRMDIPLSALDLGCGRGEWLEVLRENGIAAIGVDLDPQMLSEAQNTGQTIVQADALDHLEKQPDNSVALVSAFQLVEHLPFERVKDLSAHALRVLAPGGILLLETPNPENMVVASWKFYLDPTHHRPLPPRLLSFLSRHTGFMRNKTLGLNPPEGQPETDAVTLRQVFEGMGSDYAMVAQKAADPAITAHADAFFNTRFCLSQEDFVAAYDADTGQYREQIDRNREQIKELNYQIKAVNVRLQHEADTARAELNAIHASLSWRITRPLRALKKLLTGAKAEKSEPADPALLQMPPATARIYEDLKQAVKDKERKPD